jgi:hypothetical protein
VDAHGWQSPRALLPADGRRQLGLEVSEFELAIQAITSPLLGFGETSL